MNTSYDLCVCGAGTAGMAAALFAARRGARVLLVEAGPALGGTTNMSGGMLSAGGTRRQAERGIADSPEQHYQDVMRIGHDKSDPVFTRLAVSLQPAMIDWMMESGFEAAPECPQVIHRHEAYSIARTYWGVEKGRSITRLFEPLLRAEPTLAIRLGTRLTALLEDGQGGVRGVRLANADGTEEGVAAQSVALTTGGYAANPTLFSELTFGKPLVSGSLVHNTGVGLQEARRLGAAVRGGELFLPKFGGIEDPPGSRRINPSDFPSLTPQTRPPVEIYVNLRGERFVAEDHPSMDARERALMDQPEMTFWILFDARMMREAPSLIPRWTPERWEKAFSEHPSFVRATEICMLAARMGVPWEALDRTIGAFNAGQASGQDAFGRRHMPFPLAEAPFHAVKNHGTTYTCCAGLAIDTAMRVVRADGAAIPGLYAAGEILGRELLSGDAYVGGMSLTPALAFGRLIGETVPIG
ncbi:MAG: FAD-dependent oxidoreductase [Alphaproteobacteria bacterium]|nr:FAD-dependent oxidoreductase [Alphaproteobacteria bacterium]